MKLNVNRRCWRRHAPYSHAALTRATEGFCTSERRAMALIIRRKETFRTLVIREHMKGKQDQGRELLVCLSPIPSLNCPYLTEHTRVRSCYAWWQNWDTAMSASDAAFSNTMLNVTTPRFACV